MLPSSQPSPGLSSSDTCCCSAQSTSACARIGPSADASTGNLRECRCCDLSVRGHRDRTDTSIEENNHASDRERSDESPHATCIIRLCRDPATRSAPPGCLSQTVGQHLI